MTADLALALLINRTSAYYLANPPLYMTYVERTHVSAAGVGRTQDLNRSVAVRVADNYAVMQDLPNGSQRTGQAFPIVAYFDPFSNFSFGYFANLKRVDITLQRGSTYQFPIPQPDPSVNLVVPYNSFWAATYAPDSTDSALHLLIVPTPRVKNGLYPAAVIEDPETHLPAHIEMRSIEGDESFSLDYKVVENHWIITHGTFSATQHVAFMTFKVIADVTFSDIAFPAQAPDPRLAGAPSPSPSASAVP
ncbi:MAG TPA: hypothetical protein VHX17_06760 [Candidatus Cybelea sp.]|jgi:hypothetical protein|nr:hypothetical protein [Candidatus Cybelea sp.]